MQKEENIIKDVAKKVKHDTAQIVMVSLLLFFALEAFLNFFQDNRKQLLSQTDSYIEDSTRQTCARIRDVIESGEKEIVLLANVYGKTLTEPVIDVEILREMTGSAIFDDAEFVSADGEILTGTDQRANIADFAYFQEGMKGNSGKTLIHNARSTHDTKMVFYTPFYFQGEIIGVLNGVLKESTILNILSTNYFGIQTRSYLIERNGDIILSQGDTTYSDNLLEGLIQEDRLSKEDRKILEDVLNDQNDIDFATFNYNGAGGSGSAYIMPLYKGWNGSEESEWMLVQAIPSLAVQNMVRSFNGSGLRLMASLAVLVLIYFAYLMLRAWGNRRKLLSKNQEFSRIIDAIMTLFSAYVLVDLEKDTFAFHGELGIESAMPKGSYTGFVQMLNARVLSDNERNASLSDMLGEANIRKRLKPDVPYLQYEYQIQINEEESHWENISILCMERKDDQPVKVLLAMQNNDALKEHEMRVREALQEITAASQAANRSKTDFLARMSHDMRTPMNAIMGMTTIATKYIDNQERVADCLSKINVSSRHLLSLINDVLDMAKIESGKITLTEGPFNIADLIDGVLAIIRTQAEKKHQDLKVHLTDIRHENCIGDALRLRQVLINILGNAVKFTRDGGAVTFSIREYAMSHHDMAEYEFVCEDNGIGMDQEFLKTIFEPFTRDKNAVRRNIEGTGLGMPITRSIVQMMDGEITVQSEPGVGSVFTVRVSLKLQDPSVGETEDLEGLRVLVVDDDRDCCISTCEMLSSIGVKAQWVQSGDEAVKRTMRAHAQGADFSAVILDWQMPGKNGVETALDIREKVGHGVPIIILSAYDWSDIEEMAGKAGIGAFVAKPLFQSRLVYALKTVLPSLEPGAKEPEIPEQKDFTGKHVLVVDDNELNREIGKELLAMFGIRAETAQDGQIAYELVKNQPKGFYDLIFMDIQMPGMDGYEATRAIRELEGDGERHVPIVALSANAFDSDVRKAKESGMVDHLAKPVEVSRLQEILNKWL